MFQWPTKAISKTHTSIYFLFIYLDFFCQELTLVYRNPWPKNIFLSQFCVQKCLVWRGSNSYSLSLSLSLYTHTHTRIILRNVQAALIIRGGNFPVKFLEYIPKPRVARELCFHQKKFCFCHNVKSLIVNFVYKNVTSNNQN